MRSLSFIKDADEKLLRHKPERVVVASNVEELRNAAVRHQINRSVKKHFVLRECRMSKTFKDMNDNLTIAEMADKSQWYDLISGNDLWKISKQFYGDLDK